MLMGVESQASILAVHAEKVPRFAPQLRFVYLDLFDRARSEGLTDKGFSAFSYFMIVPPYYLSVFVDCTFQYRFC